jgi:CRP/FNR family transcriptional regulator, cyclic AMP receptor protein
VRLFAQDTKVNALSQAPLFAGLSKKELTALARVTEDMEVPQGKVLCKEGDFGHEFFVIVDGEAEVTRKGKRLATDRSGDFFGEISLLEQTPRTATVTAKSSLRVFVLTGPSFRHLLDENPKVERKVLHALARRLLSLSNDPSLA